MMVLHDLEHALYVLTQELAARMRDIHFVLMGLLTPIHCFQAWGEDRCVVCSVLVLDGFVPFFRAHVTMKFQATFCSAYSKHLLLRLKLILRLFNRFATFVPTLVTPKLLYADQDGRDRTIELHHLGSVFFQA